MTKAVYKDDKNSRIYKALKNSTLTLMCQLVFLLVSFICRTIFTYLLGTEYLGVNGLFANIITILSFTELGIGTALVYRLYGPIVDRDYRKIAALMKLYRRIYGVIIAVILALGLAIEPFIHFIVQAPDINENIRLIFGLYLIQTAVSYMFVYKKTILIADQKSYVVNIYTQVFSIVQNAIQIIVLLINKSFVTYLMIGIVFNVISNIACSLRVDRDYREIKNYNDVRVDDDVIKGLLKDAKGLLYTKLAATAYSGTDNIFISIFLGIRYVGILSNYTLLLGIINGIMNKIFDSVTASIGNLISTGNKNELSGVVKKLFFVNAFLYGIVGLEMLFLLRTFVVKIWLTDEYYLPLSVVWIVIVEMILRSMHYPVYIARNAIGAFSEYKKSMVVLACLNIILDYFWVKPFGIIGLYLSTIICREITYFLDVLVLFRLKLNTSVITYYQYTLKWIMFLLVTVGTVFLFMKIVFLEGIAGILAYAVSFFVIYMAFFLVFFYRDDEFRFYYNLIRRIVKR